MPPTTYLQVQHLLHALTASPAEFFANARNQTESMVLEYKASFAYDTALALCPHTSKTPASLLNDALALRILETIAAFANTSGGLLVLGVAERKGQIVDKTQKVLCRQGALKNSGAQPCHLSLEDLSSIDVGALRIFGLDRELELSGMDFDTFQRELLQRFSLGSGRHARKGISFKPAQYPCSPRKNPIQTVCPSTSPDLLIEDIVRVDFGTSPDTRLLCAILVAPSDEPVTLDISEDGSHTVKSVFPLRKPGKTHLEYDHQRIIRYTQKRFRNMGEEVLGGLSRLLDEKLSGLGAGLASKRQPEWKAFAVLGSSFQLERGIASTQADLNGCSPAWFSGETTVIIGAGALKGKDRGKGARGSWTIEVDRKARESWQLGYLLIGCQRFFGGLHSGRRGAGVEVLLNGRPIDGFSLLVIPPDHSDYFHRIKLPQSLPDISPLSACQTLYAWTILKPALAPGVRQIITVDIEKDVAWDVDYVALACTSGQP